MHKETDVPQGYIKDAKGHLIPENMVKDIDRLRDTTVTDIVEKAKVVSHILADFKAHAMAEIEAFVDISSEQYGVQRRGAKGNLSLVSIDGQYQIKVAVSETLHFDERLHVAKDLIDECIKDWTEGSRSELKTLINDAFAVDKEGKLNTKRILSLRRLNIDDERWKRAMDAISDGLQVVGSKSYLRVYEKNSLGGYSQLNLDLSNA